MGHVRDVDAQAPASTGKRLARDGIIKVTGGYGVYRHAEQPAKVATARLRGKGPLHIDRDGPRLLKRGLAKMNRQSVARNDLLNGQVKALRPPNPALDRDHAGLVPRGIREDARLDDVTLGHAQALGALVVRKHEEVAPDALVECHDGAKGPGNLERSHESLARAPQNPLHHGLGLARTAADEHDGCLVPVHALAKAATSHEKRPLGRLDRGRSRTRNVQRTDIRRMPAPRGTGMAVAR